MNMPIEVFVEVSAVLSDYNRPLLFTHCIKYTDRKIPISTPFDLACTSKQVLSANVHESVGDTNLAVRSK